MCLSVLTHLKNHMPKLHQIFSVPVAVCGAIVICYVLPVFWITSYLPDGSKGNGTGSTAPQLEVMDTYSDVLPQTKLLVSVTGRLE